MEITTHSFWTILHGMGFGALYLLACSGLLMELRRPALAAAGDEGYDNTRFIRWYFALMVLLAWASVLSGTYVVYPWYRAVAPAGLADLTAYPRNYLLAHPNTAGWHAVGMEWKEHVAFFTPISITAAAAIFFQYGRRLREFATLRRFTMAFVTVSFACALFAGVWGAMINKYAPVNGGSTIHIMQENEK